MNHQHTVFSDLLSHKETEANNYSSKHHQLTLFNNLLNKQLGS